jgi:hypothetical protein
MERRTAEREGRPSRALLEIDYLLMVADAIRPGALRFKEVLVVVGAGEGNRTLVSGIMVLSGGKWLILLVNFV